MSFGKLLRQQRIKMKTFFPLYISLFVLILIFSLSFIPAYVDANGHQNLIYIAFNRYMLLIFYFNVSVITSLAVLHFRTNDIYLAQTRKIWFQQAFFQVLFINTLIWCYWFLFTLMSLMISGNAPFDRLLFVPLFLKGMDLFISQLLLVMICLTFYFLLHSKIFAFIITFFFNVIFFSLSVNKWPSVTYEYLRIQNTVQEFTNMAVNTGILLLIAVCAYVILMKKDIL